MFLKHRNYGNDIESRRILRLLQPWLKRYTGECKKIVGAVKERKWEIGYGIVHWQGKWNLMGREECERRCGTKALEREERDEEDWVNY